MKKLFPLIMTALVLTSCGPSSIEFGVGIGPSRPLTRSQSFVNLLNSRFATRASNTFYVAKDERDSVTPGFVVVYSDELGFVAYDIANYNEFQSWNTYVNNYEFQPSQIHGTYNNGFETFYYGDVYDRFGFYQGEFTFEQVGEKHKDLAKIQAVKEKYVESKVAAGLTKEFGLSQEGSQKIAKLYTRLARAQSKGALTRAEDQQLARDLFGTDMSSLENMYKRAQEGDAADYNSLIEKVSGEYGFQSPEHFNQVVTSLLQ